MTVTYKEIVCNDRNNCLILGWINNYWNYLRQSSDGGITWNTLIRDTTFPRSSLFRTIAYPDTINIFAGDDDGSIHRSHDAGKTWQAIPTETMGKIEFIRMFDALTGVAYTYHMLMFTNDGWETIEYIELADIIGSINLLSDIQILAPGVISLTNNEVFARSDDGGRTWNISRLPLGVGWRAMDFVNDQQGWIAGSKPTGDGHTAYDMIAHTNNGGQTWEIQLNSLIEPSFGLTDIDFADEHYGTAVGNSTKILHTSDGGLTWEYYPFPQPLDDIDRANLTVLTTLAYPHKDIALAGSNDEGLILRYNASSEIVGISDNSVFGSAHCAFVYPNPALSTTKIAINDYQSGNVVIFNVQGTPVVELAVNADNIDVATKTLTLHVDTSKLPIGVYFVGYAASDGQRRFVKLVVGI